MTFYFSKIKVIAIFGVECNDLVIAKRSSDYVLDIYVADATGVC